MLIFIIVLFYVWLFYIFKFNFNFKLYYGFVQEAGLEAFVGRAEQAARTRRYETLKRRRQGPRETLDGMNRAPAPETLEPSSLAYWLHRIARQAAKARG